MEVVEVDKMSMLDGELAMRVGSTGVMIARGSLPKLQQAHLYDEDNQHDKNARDNVFEAHGVSLEGE